MARHEAEFGEPDGFEDRADWERTGRRPLPWRLVFGLGVPLGLVAALAIWLTRGGTDPAMLGSDVVVAPASVEPTDWVPGANAELGTGAPVPTVTAVTTATAWPTAERTPSSPTSPASPSAPPAPLVFSARYEQSGTEPGKFAADVRVTNGSARSGSWELRLDYPSPDRVKVTSVTNATFHPAGGELVFTGGPLGGGDTVIVHFEAVTHRQQTSPTTCTINGTACVGF